MQKYTKYQSGHYSSFCMALHVRKWQTSAKIGLGYHFVTPDIEIFKVSFGETKR